MAVHFPDKLQNLAASQVVVENRIVREVPNVSFHLCAVAMAVEPIDDGATPAGNQDPHEHPDGRSLSGPVRPEETKNLAFLDAEVEVTNCGELTVDLAQFFQCDQLRLPL